MPEKKKPPEKLESYEPGATKEEVMVALSKAAKLVKKSEK